MATMTQWTIEMGDSVARDADALGIIHYGDADVARLTPDIAPHTGVVIIRGHVSCHGCSIQIPFECKELYGCFGGGLTVTCPHCQLAIDFGSGTEKDAKGRSLFLYAAPSTMRAGQSVRRTTISIDSISIEEAQ